MNFNKFTNDSFTFLRKDDRLSVLIEQEIEFQIWEPILVKKADILMVLKNLT